MSSILLLTPGKSHGHSAATIAESLRSDILAGRLPPGVRLGEVALASRFDVSRGPVREALRRLADGGLVVFTPNVGARVRRLSIPEARALYELREALEGEAARLAAQRATTADLADLAALLAEHTQAINAHPEGAYLQGGGDADYHGLIARLSGNAPLARLLNEEIFPQILLLRRRHRQIQGRGKAALREHERVAEAVADREADLACLLMRRHIRTSWRTLEEQLDPTEDEADET